MDNAKHTQCGSSSVPDPAFHRFARAVTAVYPAASLGCLPSLASLPSHNHIEAAPRSRMAPRERRDTTSCEYTNEVIRFSAILPSAGSISELECYIVRPSVSRGAANGDVRWREAINGDATIEGKATGFNGQAGLGICPHLRGLLSDQCQNDERPLTRPRRPATPAPRLCPHRTSSAKKIKIKKK